MNIHAIGLIDKVIDKNKNLALVLAFIILCYLSLEIYKTKVTIQEHTRFINQIRSIAIIQEANNIVKNRKDLNSINLFIVSEYCDIVEQKGLLTNSCSIIFNHINSIANK